MSKYDEFYALQETIDRLNVQVSTLTKERDTAYQSATERALRIVREQRNDCSGRCIYALDQIERRIKGDDK